MKLILTIVLLTMTLKTASSQTLSTESNSLTITYIQRDSLVSKLQHRNALIKIKIPALENLIRTMDSIQKVLETDNKLFQEKIALQKTEIRDLKKDKIDFRKVIAIDNLQIKSLEKKVRNKSWTWFFTGTGFGAALFFILKLL